MDCGGESFVLVGFSGVRCRVEVPPWNFLQGQSFSHLGMFGTGLLPGGCEEVFLRHAAKFTDLFVCAPP